MKRDPNSDLWQLVERIPPGHLASYGALGAALKHPATGWEVGRRMANCPADIPWWRVVAKDGRLPVDKRDPELARLQETMLKKEKIRIKDGVAIGPFWDPH